MCVFVYHLFLFFFSLSPSKIYPHNKFSFRFSVLDFIANILHYVESEIQLKLINVKDESIPIKNKFVNSPVDSKLLKQ